MAQDTPEAAPGTESADELIENPGGPEDDSYANPETLSHRSGYDRRADFGSAANTINQLEEDDRVKEPVIRFPRIDSGLSGWYDMKRRLNEATGVKFGFDYNSWQARDRPTAALQLLTCFVGFLLKLERTSGGLMRAAALVC